MATFETMRAVVNSGSDLIIFRKTTRENVRELAEIARRTGATLTVPLSYPSDFVLELAAEYGKTIRFMHGLSDYQTT
jgi:hypothetical protein